MGNCEEFVDMTLSSIYEVVERIIIVFDTTSKDNTVSKINEWKEKLNDKLIILNRPFEHDPSIKFSNSNARNFYLDYLKQNFMGEWTLVLDADEVVDERVKDFIPQLQNLTENDIISPQMRHLIYTLNLEDTTRNIHFVHNRLFKVNDNLQYPNGEHPVLYSKSPNVKYLNTNYFVIWHLSYINGMFDIRKKYFNHKQKSEIHTSQELRQWYLWHTLTEYPVKKFDPTELPKVVKDYFEISDQELYYKTRKNLELKHIIDLWQWKQYFNL